MTDPGPFRSKPCDSTQASKASWSGASQADSSQAGTYQAGASQAGSSAFWSAAASALTELKRVAGRLIAQGNRRQLILRSADDRTLLRLPVTLAALFSLLLLWQAAPLLILGALVALVCKVQFILATDSPVAPRSEPGRDLAS